MKRPNLVPVLLVAALLIISGNQLRAEVSIPAELPDIERMNLLNGMRFLFFENESDEEAAFVLMIHNGAAFDPVGKWGVTYLMSRMMLENLVEKNFQQELTERGIEIESRVEWDAIYFLGSAPVEHLEFALLALSEVLATPDFQEETFDRMREELLEEILEERKEIPVRTQILFQEEVFQDNPYGHPVRGTAETVRSLYFRDIKIQARRLLMPNQTRCGVYYSGDREALFRRLSRRWGRWVRKEPAPFTFRRASHPSAPVIRLLDLPEAAESLVRWGYLGVEKGGREYFVLQVLEQYLTLSIPDWAAQVSASSQVKASVEVAARKMPGYFEVSLAADSEDILQYVDYLQETLQAMKEGDLDLSRLQEAKTLVYQEFLRDMSDTYGRIMEIFGTELYELGINYITTYHLRLDRVTEEVFSRTIEKLFPAEGFVLVAAGPASEFEGELSEMSSVVVLK